MSYRSFKIIPILGRKTDVPIDDPTMFKSIGEGVFLTHDSNGINFDLVRKRNACSKSEGYDNWSTSAISSATGCQGLFELREANQTSNVFFDHGTMSRFDNAYAPVTVNPPNNFALNSRDDILYSMCRVGDYLVFTDGKNPPFKWKHNQTDFTLLIASGESYRFKYLFPFQRRVIGLYTDGDNGEIDVRYSSAWPATAIEDMTFSSSNQLYIPNDDLIQGGSPMGQDRAFIYCRDSIQQMIYYPDYQTPFRLITIVSQQGGYHHSIVNLGDRHLVFNRNYGFCEYRGTGEFPYGGKPLSADIDADIANIDTDYYDRIQGCFLPFDREVVWTVPLSSDDPNRLFFFNIDTGQWRFEDKAMRYVCPMRLRTSYTWNDLITDLGGSGALWSAASTDEWVDYIPDLVDYLAYANTDGYLYIRTGEDLNGSNLDGYRIEPAFDFGAPTKFKTVYEIWWGMSDGGNYSVDVSYRIGDTIEELEGESWTSLGSQSLYSPAEPKMNINLHGRYFQFKWGTNLKDEKFQVNWIDFRYKYEDDY